MTKPVACLSEHDGRETRLRLWCPGCDTWHDPTVRVEGGGGIVWGWDGDLVKPTLTPSINVTSSQHGEPTICHSFVRDGVWDFLSDCTHALAGQKVPCPPGEDWEWGWIEQSA